MSMAASMAGEDVLARAKQSEDQLAGQVLVSLHRLAKQSTLYDADNEAQTRLLHMTQQAIADYGRRTGRNPKLYFTDKSVFIGKRLLRAGRTVYAAALELGALLRRFDIDEVAIGYDVPVEELKELQAALRDAMRKQGGSPKARKFSRIRLRKGNSPGDSMRLRDAHLLPKDVVVRQYCTAIVVMRRFLAGLQTGRFSLPAGVRRVAEQLSDLGAVQTPAFLGTTALYNSRHEHAGRAVNSALLALGMIRQLTDEPRILSRVALAALLYDAGVPRVAGAGPTGEGRVGVVLPRLGVEQLEELPAATLGVTTALAGVGDAGMMLSTMIYEAQHLAHFDEAGAPYCGSQTATLEGRIVAAARRFVELIGDPDEEHTADAAVCRIIASAKEEGAKTTARLLMSALGLFASGTLVELTTGDVAQVVQTHPEPRLFSYPVVRPVVNAAGGRIDDAPFIDLLREAESGRGIAAVRVVALGAQAQAAKDLGQAQSKAEQRRAARRTVLGMPNAGGAGGGLAPRLAPDVAAEGLEVELPPMEDIMAPLGHDPDAEHLEDADSGLLGTRSQRPSASARPLDSGPPDPTNPVPASLAPQASAPPTRMANLAPLARMDTPPPLTNEAIFGAGAFEHGFGTGEGDVSFDEPVVSSGDTRADSPFESDDEAPTSYSPGIPGPHFGAPAGSPREGDDEAPTSFMSGLQHGFGTAGGAEAPVRDFGTPAGGFAMAAPEMGGDLGSGVPASARHRFQPAAVGGASPSPAPDDDGGETAAFSAPAQLAGAFGGAARSAGNVTGDGLEDLVEDALAGIFDDEVLGDPFGGEPFDAAAGSGGPAYDGPEIDVRESSLPDGGGLDDRGLDDAGPHDPGVGDRDEEGDEAETGIFSAGIAGALAGFGPAVRGPSAVPAASQPPRSRAASMPAAGSYPPAGSFPPAGGSFPPQSGPQSFGPGSRRRPRQPTGEWFQERVGNFQPSATGSLARTPMVHLLIYALDQKLTGTTLFGDPSGAYHAVFFQAGLPCKVRTAGNVHALDRVLVDMGVVDEDVVQRTVSRVLRTGQLHGEFLIEQQLIDDDTLEVALSLQLVRKLGYLLELPDETSYGYYSGINVLDDYGGKLLTPTDPLAVLMTGVRSTGDSPLMLATLERLAELPLALHPSADLSRLALTDVERRVPDMLKHAPMTLEQLVAASVAPPLTVCQMVYVLAITRFLMLGAESRSPVGVDTPVPKPAPRLDPAPLPPEPPAHASRVGAQAGHAPAADETDGYPAAAPDDYPPLPRGYPPAEDGYPPAPQGYAGGLPSPDGYPPAPQGYAGGSPSPDGYPPAPQGYAGGSPSPPHAPTPSEQQAATPAPPRQRLPRAGGPASERNPRQPVREPAPPPAREPIAAPPVRGLSGLRDPRSRTPDRASALRRSAAPEDSPGGARRAAPLHDQPARGASPNAQGLPRAGSPPARRAPEPPTPPRRRPAAAEDRGRVDAPARAGRAGPTIEEIEERAAGVERLNHFEVLGVAPDAAADAIQTAYFRLAKTWHPDRLPGQLQSERAKVSKIFAKINEAYQTLSDPARRTGYEQEMQVGMGTQAERQAVERAVDSAFVFQKGEVLFKKGQYAAAEGLVQQAVHADPDQPEYRALLAWIQALRLGNPPALAEGERTNHYAEQIKQLDQVLTADPEFERAIFYRAELLKRSGFYEKSIADYRKCVQLNPRNIDAAREMRLYEKRSQKSGGGGGIFGRLFKKSDQ